MPSPVRPTALAPTVQPIRHRFPQTSPVRSARVVPGMAAFSLFFGCQKREKAWQRAKRCAACRPRCLRRPGRSERNCIAKPALPALDPPLSPVLAVGCLRRGAWRLGGERRQVANAVDGCSIAGVKRRGAAGKSLPVTYQGSVAWSPNSLQGSRACPPISAGRSRAPYWIKGSPAPRPGLQILAAASSPDSVHKIEALHKTPYVLDRPVGAPL